MTTLIANPSTLTLTQAMLTPQECALQNAEDDKHLPELPADYVFNSFQLYLGEHLDRPAYFVINPGDPTKRVEELYYVKPEENVIQMLGDDGYVFIAVDGVTHLNRIKNCQLPKFGTSNIQRQIDAIAAQF